MPDKQEPLQDDQGNISPDVRELVDKNFNRLLWKDEPTPTQSDEPDNVYSWVNDTNDPLFDTKQELARLCEQLFFPGMKRLSSVQRLQVTNAVNHITKFYLRPKLPAVRGDDLDAMAEMLGARKVPRTPPLQNRYVLDMQEPISGNKFGLDVTAKVAAIQAQLDAAYQCGRYDGQMSLAQGIANGDKLYTQDQVDEAVRVARVNQLKSLVLEGNWYPDSWGVNCIYLSEVERMITELEVLTTQSKPPEEPGFYRPVRGTGKIIAKKDLKAGDAVQE